VYERHNEERHEMTEGLFLIDKDNVPKRMHSRAFDSEDAFQALLAEFPELLTDADFGEVSPRQWILVTREAMVPDKLDGSGRWSLDHLFLDQDGVPTLVEIKRASDTRARREVVAQMLGYAANAVSWWDAEQIKGWLDGRCKDMSGGSAELLQKSLGVSAADQEGFWRRVKANLGSRRIRLIFVAERIDTELETIVLFLNEQMKDTTVVALELAQFTDGASRILRPRLIGMSPQSVASKSATGLIPETVDDWLASVADSTALPAIRRFIDLMTALGAKARPTRGSLAFDVTTGDRNIAPVYLRANGRIALPLGTLMRTQAFEDESMRKKLTNDFRSAGFVLSNSTLNGEPSFDALSMESAERWNSLRDLLTDVLHRLASLAHAPLETTQPSGSPD
jgi:hypothetical protein